MKTLAKTHYDYILKLINEKENINRILSYAIGAGFDTKSYSSPICYLNGKLSIRYRRLNTYYYL